jgi:hypothetical protein
MNIRDRIVGFERIPAGELLNHEGNFREHPQAQKNAMSGVLSEIGFVGALVVYRSERAGGQYVLIDGHMRKNQFPLDEGMPCVVTDLNDEEADLVLQAFDAVSSLAHLDRRALQDLRDQNEFLDASVRVMLDGIDTALSKSGQGESAPSPGDPQAPAAAEGKTIPEMELQPFEHYDYALVLFRTTFDWLWFCERMGLQKVDGSPDPRRKKVGLGRAIPGDKLVAALREADEIKAQAATAPPVVAPAEPPAESPASAPAPEPAQPPAQQNPSPPKLGKQPGKPAK